MEQTLTLAESALLLVAFMGTIFLFVILENNFGNIKNKFFNIKKMIFHQEQK